jgi:hypothetical protein
MPADPHSGSNVWKAPDREIGKPGENRGKVIVHRNPQPSATSDDAEPFRIQWLSANRLPRPTIPVRCVALIASLPMQVGVHPRTLGAFVLLIRFVRPRAIGLRIPPQAHESGCEFRRRLGCDERLAEFVHRHVGDSRHVMVGRHDVLHAQYPDCSG